MREFIEKKMEKTFPFEILYTQKDGNYEFLAAKIIKEKITDIIICGGDGTISQVAAGLLDTEINIGIIPMGSGNGLALAAGIPKNSAGAMKVILKGKASFIDGFYINNQFSCMLCGLGFDAQVAHDFSKQQTRGLATYIRQTLKNFLVANTYPFSIHINDTKIDAEVFFISIANSNQFGNNVTIAPKATLNDGLLDIVIVNKMSKLNLIYSVIRQIKTGKVQNVTKKGFENKGIQYLQAKKMIIYNPTLAPLHIDGEPCETNKKFEINIIENAFRLLQP